MIFTNVLRVAIAHKSNIPNKPKITRLRWVRSSDPVTIQAWTRAIEQRIQIYSIYESGGKHYVWFVPGDFENDLPSGDLDNGR